ncbi:MAG: rod-binding protein [Lachnospiraceae bacterium]|nr:rod-binding protein [Lachnospiraceae bacterium]
MSNISFNNYDLSNITSNSTGKSAEAVSAAKAEGLKNSLDKNNLKSASDEDLMKVCKEFEAYLIEQMYKEMKATVKSEDDEGEYMKVFGDKLVQEYASATEEQGGFGIAQTLYESMKRQL